LLLETARPGAASRLSGTAYFSYAAVASSGENVFTNPYVNSSGVSVTTPCHFEGCASLDRWEIGSPIAGPVSLRDEVPQAKLYF